MKLFLLHERTKADITEYLAKMILEYNKHSEKVLITSAAGLHKMQQGTHSV